MPILKENPSLALDLIAIIRGLDSIVRICNQQDRALAQMYSWTLCSLTETGTLENIVDFYLEIQNYEAHWVTAKLLIELTRILDLE